MCKSRMCKMDDILLPEIAQIILLNLPLPEILRFRLICKKAKYIVDNYVKLNNLIIYMTRPPINRLEFYTYEPFQGVHSVKIWNFDDNYNDLFRQSLFSNLKKLMISCEIDNSIEIHCNLLNSFGNLKSLELDRINLAMNDTLRLSNLRILTIKYSSSMKDHKDKLTLDTIKLKRLRLEAGTHMNLEIVHPDKITYLRIEYYHNIVKSLTNLEVLICDKLERLDKDLFGSLKNLKEFHFDSELALFNEVKSQANLLDRNELKIYLKGIEFESIDGQEFSEESSKQIINHFFVNSNRTADIIPFVKYLEYDHLEDKSEQVLVDLARKFVDLELILANRAITNKERFLNFLSHLNPIRWLKLKNSLLDQNFYDHHLLQIFPNIEFLKIKEENELIDILNFSFLLKLEHLCIFKTNKNMPFDLCSEIFKNLKYIFMLKMTDKKGRNKRKITILLNESELSISSLEDQITTTKNRLLDDLTIFSSSLVD